MTLLDTVSKALAAWPQPRADGSRILVPTHCMYGSGGIVTVVVEGGRETFQVHDDGGAINEFEAAGGSMLGARKIIASFLRDQGFMVDALGCIASRKVNLEALPAAIALVSNASKEAAEHLLDRWRPVMKRKFKDVVRDLLDHEFPKRWTRDREFVGHSNKPHKFDFVIALENERQLVLDAVVPETTAISTATVRHIDMAATHDKRIVQRILYDDRQEWKASDLNLLKLGAPPVPFSRASEILERLAA